MLRTQTYSHKAFQSVGLALSRIAEYNISRQLVKLQEAQNELDIANKEDPQYLDAIFYSGLVKDLIGKPADASPLFERVVNEIDDSRIKNEASYNLSVSYYHRYNHSYLQKAAEGFKELLTKTNDLALIYLTYSSLAQTYAMWMIPNDDQKKRLLEGEESEKKFIQEKFDEFKKYEKKARLFLRWRKIKTETKNKIRAMVKNAHGMALMYYTDYISKDAKEKLARIRKAIRLIEQSEILYPEDWANTCDFGSAHWRLAMSYRTLGNKAFESEYSIAIETFERVLEKLRPDYGFALYELGRIYRTKGDFDKAIYFFDKSLEIERDYRDVGDKTLISEKERAQKRIASYP